MRALPSFWLIFIAASWLSLPPEASADEKDERLLLGLMKVTQGEGFTDQQVGTIETVLLNALDGTGRFRVVGRADLLALLNLEAQKQAAGCSTDGCMTEIAGALGVDLLASAEVGRLGDVRIVSLKVIAVRTATVLARAQRTLSNDSELVGAAESIAREIVQAVDKQPSLSRTAPTPASTALHLPPSIPSELLQPPDVGLSALLQAAIVRDADGRLHPDVAAESWTRVVEASGDGPFKQAALARARQWQDFSAQRLKMARDRERLTETDTALLANPDIGASVKARVLDDYVAAFGPSEGSALVTKARPEAERTELCAHLGDQARQVNVDVTVIDSHFYGTTGQAFADGREAGHVPGTIQVPVCTSRVEVRGDVGRGDRRVDLRSDGPNREEIQLDDSGSFRGYLTVSLGVSLSPTLAQGLCGSSSCDPKFQGEFGVPVGAALYVDWGRRWLRFGLAFAYVDQPFSGTATTMMESAPAKGNLALGMLGGYVAPTWPVLDRGRWHVTLGLPLGGVGAVTPSARSLRTATAEENFADGGPQGGLLVHIDIERVVIRLEGTVTGWVHNGSVGASGTEPTFTFGTLSPWAASLAVGYRFFP